MHNHILVTGGAGFIGSHLIRTILQNNPNCKIISLDNYFTGTTANHVRDNRVEYLVCNTWDINKPSLDSLVRFKPDVVYHLGEFSRIVKSFDDIDYCHQSNIVGTFQVLKFCQAVRAKLVYAASSSKFGNEGRDQHLSPYAWMKAKNIELIHNWRDWFDLDFAIAYFFNVYGPGQISTGDYATVIGRFQDQVLQDKKLTVVAPGTQRRDFTHVYDIVSGLVAVGERGSGDDFLLGTGKNYTLLEIAEAFDHPYEMIPERKGERFSGQAYQSKAQSELGWSPEFDVIEYIKSWKASLK